MKHVTTIEQSRMLAEILPKESADMCYLNDGTAIKIDATPYGAAVVGWKEWYSDIIPCWSLAALLYVLPNNEHISTILSRGGWKIESIEYVDKWCCEYEDDNDTKDFLVSADNPIDACYEMIVKLKEIKLL